MNFDNIPTGLTIFLTLSDKDATAFADNYLKAHDAEIKNLIHEKIKVSLDISDPEIFFNEDELTIKCRIGLKLVKVNASAKASAHWAGKDVLVNVTSLDIPVVSIDPSKANELIRKPIQSFMNELQKAFTIRYFRVENGRISVDAVKS